MYGEEVQLDENAFKIKKLPGYRKTVRNEVGNSIHHFNDGSKVYAAQGQSSSGRTLQYHKIKNNGEREVHSQTSLTKSFTKEEVDLGEELDFKVSVDGLPDMYVKANSPSEVKANLRKVVKKPDSIRSVDRVTRNMVRKVFRDKAAGKEGDEE
jgi:hypothetical protein